MAGSSKRTSHVGAVEVFSQVHQCQKCAENSRLEIVRQVQSARGHARQPFPVFGDEPHDFALAVLRGVAQRRFPPHLCATGFQGKREVQHAELLLGESRRRFVLASRDLAGSSHCPVVLNDS